MSTWLNQIGQATLIRYNNMGGDLNTARDFLELHERLDEDMRDKNAEVKYRYTEYSNCEVVNVKYHTRNKPVLVCY